MSKPHIDDVALVFHSFQQEMMGTTLLHLRNPAKYNSCMSAAKENLLRKLDSVGLAEYIDWEEKKE